MILLPDGGTTLRYTRDTVANRSEVLEASANLVQWIDIGSPSVVSNGDGTETVSYTGIENISPLTPALGLSGCGFKPATQV